MGTSGKSIERPLPGMEGVRKGVGKSTAPPIVDDEGWDWSGNVPPPVSGRPPSRRAFPRPPSVRYTAAAEEKREERHQEDGKRLSGQTSSRNS